MTVIWLALPLERRATLESDAINKQQNVFKICHPPYDEQPRRKGSTCAGKHMVTVYVLRVVRGVHAPSRGTWYSHVHRGQKTHVLELKRPWGSRSIIPCDRFTSCYLYYYYGELDSKSILVENT